MKIGIIGLGLIGGSFAKALKSYTSHTVYGFDTDEKTLSDALLSSSVDFPLADADYPLLDVLLVALYPSLAISAVTEHADVLSSSAIVIDCCGIKEPICNALFPLAQEKGFTFIGGHPMAGVENSGFSAASADLFSGASMVLTPKEETAPEILKKVEALFHEIGFCAIRYSTPKEHDAVIAYTSQLAHVVSSAYVQSSTALKHSGFSAGSFQDMTRVAKLYEPMWVELFLSNKEPLLKELDGLISRLSAFSNAIKEEDSTALFSLLHNGRMIKESLLKKDSRL